MNRKGIDSFLEGLERDHHWAILLLQEFDGSARGESLTTTDGHAVYIVPPCSGCRSAGIVVHKDFVHCILEDSFNSIARIGSILLHWEGHNLQFITAHLPPRSHSLEEFCEAVDDLERKLDFNTIRQYFIIHGKQSKDVNARRHHTILGVDAQANLGQQQDTDDNNIVGPYGYGNDRTFRAQQFIDMCATRKLAIMNSFVNEAGGNWTCHHWGSHPPSQLDYIGADIPERYKPKARLKDSSATKSDHVILGLSFQGIYNRIWNGRKQKKILKPIGWKLTGDYVAFNNAIRDFLCLPNLERKEKTNKAYKIFTDGSFKQGIKSRRKVPFAGWGFVVYDFGEEASADNEFFSAYGAVITSSTVEGFLGADKKTNNTAELHAIMEALIWAYLRESTSFIFYSDSMYVVRMLQRFFEPRENMILCLLARHWWDLVSKKHDASIEWVRGHSGNIGNTRADELADNGTLETLTDSYYRRPKLEVEWSAHLFATSVLNADMGASPILGERPIRKRRSASTLVKEPNPDKHLRLLDGEPIPYISDWTKSVVEAALQFGKITGTGFFEPKLDDSIPLVIQEKELSRHRRQLGHGLERKEASIKLCTIRKELKCLKLEKRAEKAVAEQRSPFKMKRTNTVRTLYDFKDTDILLDDESDLLENAEQFYETLFVGDDVKPLPDWIWKRFRLQDLQDLKAFDGHILKSLILSFGSGKTCAGDLLVAEMLFQLEVDILHQLAEVFKLRILNHETEWDDDTWCVVLLNLIPKKSVPKTVRDFRPIAILSVLSKLYSKLLEWLTGGVLVSTKCVQFAFKPGHQCHEPIFIMRRIVEIAIEWQTHVFILDGDIAKAYDYTRHDLVLEAMQARGIPDILAAALVREVARPQCKVKLGSLESKSTLRRNRALWQGDPSAPKLFNCTLDDVAFKFDKMAKRKKWGWPINSNGVSTHLCLLLFADNYWLICTSPQELQNANAYWQQCLEEAGWHTLPQDLKYGSTMRDDQMTKSVVTHRGEVITRVPRAEGFKALGTQITFNNRNDAELVRRIRAAWGAFHKHSDILCCRHADLGKRLRFFQKVVHPALFWCSGSWNLRGDQFTKLRGVQRSMLRRMLRFSRGENEELQPFMQRTNGVISSIMDSYGIISWDSTVRRNVFKWAGWVARLAFHDEQRITLIILRQKDWFWISIIASHNGGRQLHGRILKTWRWERLLYSYAAENYPKQSWFDLAQDPISWSKITDKVF